MDIIHFPDDPAAARAGRSRCSRSATSTACTADTGRFSSACAASRRERGATSVVMTFDPHPPRIVRPDKAPPLLMTKAQKLEAIAAAGVQGAAIVRFTPRVVAGGIRRRSCGRCWSTGCASRRSGSARTFSSATIAAGNFTLLRDARRRATASRPRRSIRSATRTSSSAARGSGAWSARRAWTRPARCSATSTSSTAPSCEATGAGGRSAFRRPTCRPRTNCCRRTACMRRRRRSTASCYPSVTNIGVRPTVDQSGRVDDRDAHLQPGSRSLRRVDARRVRPAPARRAGLRVARRAATRRSRPTATGRACSSIGFHCKIAASCRSARLLFSLEFSSQGVPAPLVEDLAGAACSGTSAARRDHARRADGGAREGRRPTARSAAQRRCDVQLRAHNQHARGPGVRPTAAASGRPLPIARFPESHALRLYNTLTRAEEPFTPGPGQHRPDVHLRPHRLRARAHRQLPHVCLRGRAAPHAASPARLPGARRS